MINDTELLKMIMEKHPDQGPDFIVEQYSIYKKKLVEANAMAVSQPETCAAKVEAEASMQLLSDGASNAAQEEKKKRYSKRSLKIKPEEAIQEDKIYCCLCGAAFKSLTALHLMKEHGLTPDDYKKLCGYGKDQNLMSHMNLRKVREAVAKAQKARAAKAEAQA